MASGGIPMDTGFHRNHKISHRNPSGGVFLSTGKNSLGKTSPEGVLVTQNPIGSVSALPVSLPARTLSGGVIAMINFEVIRNGELSRTLLCYQIIRVMRFQCIIYA